MLETNWSPPQLFVATPLKKCCCLYPLLGTKTVVPLVFVDPAAQNITSKTQKTDKLAKPSFPKLVHHHKNSRHKTRKE